MAFFRTSATVRVLATCMELAVLGEETPSEASLERMKMYVGDQITQLRNGGAVGALLFHRDSETVCEHCECDNMFTQGAQDRDQNTKYI